jgi:hypothetical protein
VTGGSYTWIALDALPVDVYTFKIEDQGGESVSPQFRLIGGATLVSVSRPVTMILLMLQVLVGEHTGFD